MLHNLDELDDLVHVLPSGDEPLKHEDLEVGEHVTRLAAHHVHVLLRQFEGRILEADVFSRRMRKDESVVNVDQMTLAGSGEKGKER